MTCHRRYTFLFDPVERGFNIDHVYEVLAGACDNYWWYTNTEVSVDETGHLLVEFEVAGRDQWWAHRRAMDLMDRIGYDVPIPTWVALPPHTNRGYSRVRK